MRADASNAHEARRCVVVRQTRFGARYVMVRQTLFVRLIHDRMRKISVVQGEHG